MSKADSSSRQRIERDAQRSEEIGQRHRCRLPGSIAGPKSVVAYQAARWAQTARGVQGGNIARPANAARFDDVGIFRCPQPGGKSLYSSLIAALARDSVISFAFPRALVVLRHPYLRTPAAAHA